MWGLRVTPLRGALATQANPCLLMPVNFGIHVAVIAGGWEARTGRSQRWHAEIWCRFAGPAPLCLDPQRGQSPFMELDHRRDQCQSAHRERARRGVWAGRAVEQSALRGVQKGPIRSVSVLC